eukprot:gene45429-55591_t
MTPFAALYAVHVLAALVWVGGMFFAWMVLRPAAVQALDAPARLKLWVEVFRRFFLWVWVAVVLLPVSGVGMMHMRFAGFDGAPRYVHIMMGLYIAMLALFLRVNALQLPELRRAVAAALLLLLAQRLGVEQRSAALQVLVVLGRDAQLQVGDLGVQVAVHEEVEGLDVSVAQAGAVAVQRRQPARAAHGEVQAV